MKNKFLPTSLIITGLLATSIYAKVTFNEVSNTTQRVIPGGNSTKLLSYNAILKEPQKSVVNISTTKEIYINNSLYNLYQNPFFRQFLNPNYRNKIMPPKRFEKKSYVLGSGVIVTKNGYIITNNHVVAGANSIKVTITGINKTFNAKLIGRDPKTDIAVIKINAKNLHPIKIANSSKLKVGDVVFAIGDPFGIGKSVTSGIISALNKNNVGINQYENFIQTDASINPGNSGGALVNSKGELIGINSAIITRSGGFNGIGFAIPSNMVKKIALALINNGAIKRGFLGVSIQDLNSGLRSIYKHKHGAFIIDVEKNTPASKVGLKRGDLIIQINGKPVKNANDLKDKIGSLKPNDTVIIKVENQNNKVKTFKVKLAKMPGSIYTNNNNIIKGLKVININARIRYNYGIPKNINGVLVINVQNNTKADKIGFRTGDIIIQINNKLIKNVYQYKEALEKIKKGIIYVQRENYIIPLAYKK